MNSPKLKVYSELMNIDSMHALHPDFSIGTDFENNVSDITLPLSLIGEIEGYPGNDFCRFQFDGSRYVLVDWGNPLGVYVNEKRLPGGGYHFLINKDRIGIVKKGNGFLLEIDYMEF